LPESQGANGKTDREVGFFVLFLALALVVALARHGARWIAGLPQKEVKIAQEEGGAQRRGE